MPLSSGSLVGIGIGLAAFFIAYFTYHSPYYALYPDLVADEVRRRSQGFQGVFRAVGLLLALVGGALLLSLWEPLPFLVAAATLAGVTLILFGRVRGRLGRDEGGSRSDQRTSAASWDLGRERRDIRYWFVANSLWEATEAALKAFVVLYLTVGLSLSLEEVTAALALVGAAAVVVAPLSG